MATESPQSPCNCCGDQIISLCGLPICVTASVVWDDSLEYTNLSGKDLTGLTCGTVAGEGELDENFDSPWFISMSFFYDNVVTGEGRWIGLVSSQTESYQTGFANARSQDVPVTNPLDPSGTYVYLGGGTGDARPVLGTMTLTLVDCPPDEP